MQAILQVELLLPFNHVREQVTEIGGILRQQSLKIKCFLSSGQPIQSHLLRRNTPPVGIRHTVLGVRPVGTHFLENHTHYFTGKYCVFAVRYANGTEQQSVFVLPLTAPQQAWQPAPAHNKDSQGKAAVPTAAAPKHQKEKSPASKTETGGRAEDGGFEPPRA